MEYVAELILKFDLDDEQSRDKFDAVLNSYNYYKLFTEFKRALIKSKNSYKASEDCEIIAGLKEALEIFDVLSDKYKLIL